MSQPRFLTRFLLIITLLSSIHMAFASNRATPEQNDKIIEQLYHKLEKLPQNDMPGRITAISAWLLGKPYLLGALGEGENANYDQFPLYRFDAFDCQTYVETVLAIALAKDAPTFKQCMNQIRYHQGLVSFTTRNHFTSLDWNQNNQNQGLLKDITFTFQNKSNQPVAKIATAYINKPEWYQSFTTDQIRIGKTEEQEVKQRLSALKQEGQKLKGSSAQIPYIPLTALFTQKGRPNQYLFKQIPNAAIIEIVRPNWDLRDKIGTCLNVSHLGFAIWQEGTLMFREASSIEKKTIDISLVKYLQDALDSPTIAGINVQVVLPEKSFGGSCLPD